MPTSTTQHTPFFRARILFGGALMVVAALGWWGCGREVPGELPPNLVSCTQDTDCAKGGCVGGVCEVQEVTTDASGDAPPPDINEALPEATGDATGCTSGETQPCYTGAKGTQDIGTCKGGTQTCNDQGQWDDCVGEIVTQPDQCDGLDNDCDGQVDEDYPDKGKACSIGTGACKSVGKQVCNPNGNSVTCDAKTISPRPELCNGIDDDCDGNIDEDFIDLNLGCFNNGVGACLRKGKLVCADSNVSTKCDAGPGTPAPELCDKADNDCDGMVDNTKGGSEPLTRSCYTGTRGSQDIGICKSGTYTCVDGSWTTECANQVTDKPEDLCAGQDDNCNGVIGDNCTCKNGDTLNCGVNTGQCKVGTQTCTNGVFGPCVGEVKPTKEICDSRDNNCDGRIDEDFAGIGNACTVGVGGCQISGKIVCDGTTKTKCNAVAGSPSVEICNGIDDNCDGDIDEGNPGGGTDCTASGQGNCKKGKNACQNGNVVCVPGRAIPERCRNGQDDDCDGKIDEICGPSYPYFIGGGGGAFVYRRPDNTTTIRGFNRLNRLGPGKYQLTPSNTTQVSCAKLPIFLTPYSHFRRSVSYSCLGNNDYVLHTSAAMTSTQSDISISAQDGFLNAVVPNETDDIWVTIDPRGCALNSTGNCPHTLKRGVITVRQSGKGTYIVTSPRCNKTTHPIFTTIASTLPVGWITATNNSNGTCTVRTFDGTNSLSSSISFAVWLPNPLKVAWAAVRASGSQTPGILDSNLFDASSPLWSASRIKLNTKTCPPGTTNTNCSRTRVNYPGWRTMSAAFLQFTPSPPTTVGTSSGHPNPTDLGFLFVSSFINSSPEVVEKPFFVLLVQ